MTTDTGGPAAGPRRRWPLAFIAAPAAVAVWSGWVGLGTLCGFGVIHPLPGIWASLRLNTAITLPVGVEAYGAYALGAWLAPAAPARARVFARRSAIGALGLGMAGQIVYHLLAAAHATRAPWPVVVLVSCMPVATLGLAAALTHLLHPGAARTGQPAPTGPGTWEAPSRQPDGRTALPAGEGPVGGRTGIPARPAAPHTGAPALADAAGEPSPGGRAALPPGVDRAAVVAELAAQIRAAAAAGQQWRPDYEALMARTGYRRSWCEKAVRAARERAATPDGPTPDTVQPGTGASLAPQTVPAFADGARTGIVPAVSGTGETEAAA